MMQTMHWLDAYLAHKRYGVGRGDVVVYGNEVGKVKQVVAVAWMKEPEVIVRFRDGHEERVPSLMVTKL